MPDIGKLRPAIYFRSARDLYCFHMKKFEIFILKNIAVDIFLVGTDKSNYLKYEDE